MIRKEKTREVMILLIMFLSVLLLTKIVIAVCEGSESYTLNIIDPDGIIIKTCDQTISPIDGSACDSESNPSCSLDIICEKIGNYTANITCIDCTTHSNVENTLIMTCSDAAETDTNFTFSSWNLNSTHINTTTDNENLSLIANSSNQYPNQTGYYYSKFFNTGQLISWDNLSWSYHPELPSNQINTSDSYDGFDMTGNVLLMHLNEETAIEIGNGYEDTTNLTGYWRFNENGNEESYGDHADDCTLYGDAGYDISILRKGLNIRIF